MATEDWFDRFDEGDERVHRSHRGGRRRSDPSECDDPVVIEGVEATAVTFGGALIVRRAAAGPFGATQSIPCSVIHDDSEVYDDRPDGRGPGRLVVARWWVEADSDNEARVRALGGDL